mmetsp:Transcript_85624/g.250697  ORF Transcript_85624/g.250697 Transcript_85624/m.250697 type:complete len:338 (-) Transcript_85624:274-1287(-)
MSICTPFVTTEPGFSRIVISKRVEYVVITVPVPYILDQCSASSLDHLPEHELRMDAHGVEPEAYDWGGAGSQHFGNQIDANFWEVISDEVSHRSTGAQLDQPAAAMREPGHTPSDQCGHQSGAKFCGVPPDEHGIDPTDAHIGGTGQLVASMREPGHAPGDLGETAKKKLEAYCIALHLAVNDAKYEDEITDGDRDEIEKAVMTTLNWYYSNQTETYMQYTAKQKEVEGTVIPFLMDSERLMDIHDASALSEDDSGDSHAWEEDENSMLDFSAKSNLDNYCLTVLDTVNDGKIGETLSSNQGMRETKRMIERTLKDAFDWLETHKQAEKDEYEAKQK